jgi:hypothetical protein
MKKTLTTLVSTALIATALIAMPQPAQAAPPGSAFDPGLIISDSVFFDFGTMTVSEIQKFLDSRVPDCRATDPAIDCLKNAKFEIPDTPATSLRGDSWQPASFCGAGNSRNFHRLRN